MKMKIERVYRTGLGTYWDYDTAMKNRLYYDGGSRPGDPKIYERVKEGFVLVTTETVVAHGGPLPGPHEFTRIFQLQEVEVR